MHPCVERLVSCFETTTKHIKLGLVTRAAQFQLARGKEDRHGQLSSWFSLHSIPTFGAKKLGSFLGRYQAQYSVGNQTKPTNTPCSINAGVDMLYSSCQLSIVSSSKSTQRAHGCTWGPKMTQPDILIITHQQPDDLCLCEGMEGNRQLTPFGDFVRMYLSSDASRQATFSLLSVFIFIPLRD